MRGLPLLVAGWLLILGWGAIAQTTSTVGHQVGVDAMGIVPPSDFAPLIIRQDIIRNSWEAENASFLNIRKLFANASDADKELIRAQLGLQRTNLLHVHLNSVILDFQKIDFLLEQFPVMLIRMRTVYYYRPHAKLSSGVFESDYADLQSSLKELQDSRAQLRENLQIVSRNRSESREDIEAIYAQTTQLLRLTQEWLADYTLLLRKAI